MKYARALLAAVLSTAALVEFLLWGEAGVGFTVLFLVILAAYFIACGFPAAGVRHTVEQIGLTAIIAALAMSYTLFDNDVLRAINLLALVFLLGLLFLHGTVGKDMEWDRAGFHAELWIGYFVRPFACIAKPLKELSALRKSRKSSESETARSPEKRKIIFQVLAAVLASVPLLLVLVSLLASSDPVFRDVFKPLNDWLMSLHIGDVVGRILMFLFLLPFAASSVWSYRDEYKVLGSAGTTGNFKPALIPAASAITILALVNALYLLFAGVQFAYFFGAWGGSLPDGLTPAQYARNGFFELSFISFINVILLLLSIRMTVRNGRTGYVIRGLATGLMALSTVQLISAMLRMRLYIKAFGLSQLRYFVFAFMILLALYFVFLMFREFVSSFPLFRCMLIAGASALVILNYSVPDARIASYNISHYCSGELASLDTGYIINSLSADGQVVLLQNETILVQYDPGMKQMYAEMKRQLDPSYPEYAERSWKAFNLNKNRLAQYF